MRTPRTIALLGALTSVGLALAVILGGGAAGARTTHQIRPVPLLGLSRGTFEVSLGTPPLELPLARTPQTLTLISGAPKVRAASRQNVYVGFIPATRPCSPTPATSHAALTTFTGFYRPAHSAARHAGVFAPNGGAPRSTYIASVPDVIINRTGSVHACVWVAETTGPDRVVKRKHRKRKLIHARRSLTSTLTIALENTTFAASVSNLNGSGSGHGGYDMYAIDGGAAIRYSATTTLCASTATDRTATVPAGTPGSESVALAVTPCAGDGTSFSFSGPHLHSVLTYPTADALTSPPTTVALGGCELDPLTGVPLLTAEAYLESDGCTLGKVEISPYQKTLTRGAVSWASLDGGVAELAPPGAAIDLVLNGLPPTQTARRPR